MASESPTRTPWWTWVCPLLAVLVLIVYFVFRPGHPFAVLEAFTLIVTVFVAVYHAEIVAHWVGEPFGTLILALAVTVIEVALIVGMMITGGRANAIVARDTVFAAVMMVCNGIVGLCLLAGGMRHGEQGFQLQGTKAALSVLIVLTTLALILPNVTESTLGPTFSPVQLIFAAIVSIILYAAFLFVQTVRHRDYFLPPGGGTDDMHAAPPSREIGLISTGLLFTSLLCIVLIAKSLTPVVEQVIDRLGVSKNLVGIIIAGLVLLPESLAAFRAAWANRLQTSMNLALGSVLATIGLTIPSVAAVSIVLDRPLTLGLDAKQEVLLVLTLLVSVVTLGTGRSTVLQGVVHLVLFAVFLFLAIVP